MLARQALELGWSPMKERLDKQSSSCLQMTKCLWRPCAMRSMGGFLSGGDSGCEGGGCGEPEA